MSERLANLNSLTIYSQLFAGTTAESREDAFGFLTKKGLREVHLLDVFLPRGFLADLKGKLNGGEGLQFLEVSYTFRHSEIPGEFLKSLNAREILGLLEGDRGKGLVGVNFGIREPDVVVEDEDDREGTEEGVLVAAGEGSRVVNAFGDEKGVGKELRLCDISMFELSIEEVGKILDSCEKVVVLGVSITLGKGWEAIFEELGRKERSVEVLEIVGVPGEEVVERIKSGGEVGLKREMVKGLGEKWRGLGSVKISVLRTKGEEWVRGDEGWGKS